MVWNVVDMATEKKIADKERKEKIASMLKAMKHGEYHTECKRIFVNTDEKQKNGKPKKIPVYLRTLLLRDEKSITDSGMYKVCIKGSRYYISALHKTTVDVWRLQLDGKCRMEQETTVSDNPIPIAAYDCISFMRWLSYKVQPEVAGNIMARLNYGY